MKIDKWLFITIGLIITIVCANNYISANRDISPQIVESVLKSSQIAVEANAEIEKQVSVINFQDVTFSCNLPTLCKIEKKEIQPHILEDETSKPDGIHPRYLSFKFVGKYGEQSKNSFFEPEINVYSISEFRQSLSKSSVYMADFDKKLNRLQQLIIEKPSMPKGDIPFLTLIDANQEFNAHIKYISFKNGKGMFFLTQYNTEPSIINNDGLTYVFQGITDDSKYYILATFPVRTKILPNGYQAEKFENYKLPTYFYEEKEVKRNEINYKNYVLRVKKILEELYPKQFSPNLKDFEDILSSLEVKYTATH